MPRDGSGTYTLPPGNPVIAGTTIDDVVHNATQSDIADALSASVAKDGQTQAVANLPMGGFKHTNVGAAALGNEYTTLSQIQGSAFSYVQDTSTVPNVIRIAPNPAVTAYVTGQRFNVRLNQTNSGATIITVGALSEIQVLNQRQLPLTNAQLVAGNIEELVFNGAVFILTRAAAPALPVTNAVLQVKNISAAPFTIFVPTAADIARYRLLRFQLGPSLTINPAGLIAMRFSANGGSTFSTGAADYIAAVSPGVFLTTSDAGDALPVTGPVDAGTAIFGEVDVEIAQFGHSLTEVFETRDGNNIIVRTYGRKQVVQPQNAVGFVLGGGATQMTGRIAMIGVV